MRPKFILNGLLSSGLNCWTLLYYDVLVIIGPKWYRPLLVKKGNVMPTINKQFYCRKWTWLSFFFFSYSPGSLLVKGTTIATRAASKWGGVMNKLSRLSPCHLYSAFYFNRVVCRLLPINRLANSNFESDGWIFFSNSCFWLCYQIYFSEYNMCYLHSRCLQSFISKLFVNIS